jgi:cell division protein DivIC
VLRRIPTWVTNKYLLASVGFVLLMVFFDDKDISVTLGQRKKLNDLRKSEQHLSKQILETQRELDLLKTNPHTLEQYAREKYLMKKDNEDVFILSPDSGKQ